MNKNSNSVTMFNMDDVKSIESVSGVKNFLIETIGEENIKIKPADGQMVFKYSDYYYKFVIASSRNKFQNIIRKTLAEIYKEEYGLHWEVFEKSYNDGASIIQVIEKETVTVCKNKTEIELANALSEITFKIEQKLGGFDFILDKLKNNINDLSCNYKIKLMRLSKIKNIDYGITKDGKIVLLDDSDWYLVIYDQNKNKIIVSSCPIFIVEFQGEEYYFTSIRDVDDFDSVITETNMPNYKFNLIKVNQFLDPRDMQYYLQDKCLLYYNSLLNHINKQHKILECNTSLKKIESHEKN